MDTSVHIRPTLASLRYGLLARFIARVVGSPGLSDSQRLIQQLDACQPNIESADFSNTVCRKLTGSRASLGARFSCKD